MSVLLSIEDMSKTYFAHSMVVPNFVIKIGNQLNDSLCLIFNKTVTEENKEELQVAVFSNLHISFDELFDVG